MKRFCIVIECQTPENSDDNHAHAYADSVRDYIQGPLFVEGIGFNLGVQSVEYEMESECHHPVHTNPGLIIPCPECEKQSYCEGRR